MTSYLMNNFILTTLHFLQLEKLAGAKVVINTWELTWLSITEKATGEMNYWRETMEPKSVE